MISAQYVDGLELRIREQAARIAELEAELQIAKHNEKCTHDANVNLCKELAALRRKIDEAPVVAENMTPDQFKEYLKSIGYTDPRRI